MSRAILTAGIGLTLALTGCVTGDEPSDVDGKGTIPDQKSNVTCAVGDTPNATSASGVKTGASYSRSGDVTNKQCACELWEQKYNANYAVTHSDSDAEAAADKAVTTCGPATYLVVDVEAVGNRGYTDLVALVDGPTGIGDPTYKPDCTSSNLIYVVDKLASDGVTWNVFSPETVTSPAWNANAGNCDWTAQSVRVTQPGTYRLRGKAHWAAESDTLGYLDIMLSAVPADNPT